MRTILTSLLVICFITGGTFYIFTKVSKAQSFSPVDLQKQKQLLIKEIEDAQLNARVASTKVTTKDQVYPEEIANPEIVTGNFIPNGGALMEYYDFSQNIYVDHLNWNISAGAQKSDPTIGVIIVYYLPPNPTHADHKATQTIHTIPGAGKVSITGFSGSTIYLKSDTGSGTFTLTPKGKDGGDINWVPN
jgi:hypothetical protein